VVRSQSTLQRQLPGEIQMNTRHFVHQIYFKELCNVIVYKCNLDVSTFQITKNQLT
jgi:hypothetical protein